MTGDHDEEPQEPLLHGVRVLDFGRYIAGPFGYPDHPVMLSPLQVLGNEQVVQTGMLTWVDYPGMPKAAPLVSGPVQFSDMDTGIRQRPPALGERTDQVLASVGYSASEISGLRERRIV